MERATEDYEMGYWDLPGPIRVGIEATGPIRWFERLLAELGHELWIGDAAKSRASEVRKQKTDERDARLILESSCSRNVFRKYGFPHRPNAICGSCSGIVSQLPSLVGARSRQRHPISLSVLCRDA
jgi:transposase